MKKMILSMLGIVLLAGCSGYDYYKADIRYYQSGKDCIYYHTEDGKKFNKGIDSLPYDKKVVYNDVRCEDLYNTNNKKKEIVPVYPEEKVAPKCGCDVCGKKQVLKNRYVIVSSFEG